MSSTILEYCSVESTGILFHYLLACGPRRHVSHKLRHPRMLFILQRVYTTCKVRSLLLARKQCQVFFVYIYFFFLAMWRSGELSSPDSAAAL